MEETITLYGADNKFTEHLYNRITYFSTSVADPGINFGYGSGTSKFVLGNGCKTNQTVYMTSTSVGTTATVYGLISKNPIPLEQIQLFRYELSTELTNLLASLVPNFSYVQAPFGQCYIDSTSNSSETTQTEDIYWMVGLQELL